MGRGCGVTGGRNMQVRFRWLVEDVDRYGTIRIYVRVPGRRKVRIRAPFGSEEFLAAYRRGERSRFSAAAGKRGQARILRVAVPPVLR
jgi:integrase/recombinase XerD